MQDWHLRYALESVKGVSEVAPVGGFVKEYQVDLDPDKLLAYGIPISEVVNNIRKSNGDAGGKIFEVGSTEYYVRGRGYIKNVGDIENIPLKMANAGTKTQMIAISPGGSSSWPASTTRPLRKPGWTRLRIY